MKRGLNRKEAADYIGVGSTKFFELVKAKRMPVPRLLDKRVIWDKEELDEAFDRLPRQSNDNEEEASDWG